MSPKPVPCQSLGGSRYFLSVTWIKPDKTTAATVQRMTCVVVALQHRDMRQPNCGAYLRNRRRPASMPYVMRAMMVVTVMHSVACGKRGIRAEEQRANRQGDRHK